MAFRIDINIRIILFFVLMLFQLNGIALKGEMRKGPYLIYPNSSTKMTVLWQLRNEAECKIDWGRDVSYSEGSANTKELFSGENGHIHKYTISELVPNQKYYFRVKENETYHSGTFMSGDGVGDDTTRILVYGDTRTLLTNHNIIAKSITNFLEENPKWETMLLHCGDWNSDDEETTWDKEHFNPNYIFIKKLLSKIPIMGTRGNHEYDATQFNKYYRYPYVEQGRSYYSFDYGYAHVSVVDQYTDYSVGSPQYNWLKNDVQSSTKRWKILLFHEPAYSDLGKRPNNENAQKYLQPFCEQYGIKLVFAGHNHFYAHCVVNGVNHFTFGGGGSELHPVSGTGEGLKKSISTYNYGRILLTKDKFRVIAVDANGNILDNIGVTGSLSGNEEYIIPKIEIYPNPSSDILYYNLPISISNHSITIFDNMGRVIVKTPNVNQTYGNIDVSQIASGNYIIEIDSKTNKFTQSISIIR
ncbi:MAG: metallophosphoesterase [Candidatus Kapaibacterium sp.]|nr:metallophosphoesterase [Ignavibacteriota bacterium]MCB9221314.1 metallophosphoesterase [Ignavibacteria bacterium]